MDSRVNNHSAETIAHARLKRLAFIWAQEHGYSARALEVSLPRCRYRADVAAYRAEANGLSSTAIWECKQALVDLRRDNGCGASIRARLETLHKRRQTLEKHLRIHYPALRVPDSLFVEFDSHNFGAIPHRAYTRVLRESRALQNQLEDCTKFETLVRYRCADLFFLVVPNELFRPAEIPFGWGALVETGDDLRLAQKPVWNESPAENRIGLLHRIATSGTRLFNRQLEIPFYGADLRAVPIS
jgi:hypothetical protein